MVSCYLIMALALYLLGDLTRFSRLLIQAHDMYKVSHSHASCHSVYD